MEHPGEYIEVENLVIPPVPFGLINQDYIHQLQILIDIMRRYGHDDIFVVMSPAMKQDADANGATEQIESATGLEVRAIETWPINVIGVMCSDERTVAPAFTCPY